MNRKISELVSELVVSDIASIVERDLPWEMLDHKSILITGANGFISYYLVLSCLMRNDRFQSGIKVLGLVRNLEHARKKYGTVLERDDLELCVQDVCEPIPLSELERKGPDGNTLEREHVDYIIHAASQASAWHFEHDPVGTMNANLLGTVQILELARKCKAQVLLISSLKVYGSFPEISKYEIREEEAGYIDQTSYKNCYAMGKRAAETLCASYHRQYGVPVKLVRPSYIYGPARLDDDRVWAQFMANVIRHTDIELQSSGAVCRSYCYVTDTAAAIFTVLLKGEVMQPYNIAARISNLSIRDFAATAAAAFPERSLKLRFVHPEDEKTPDPAASPREVLDSRKLQELGWQGLVPPAEGIRRAVQIMEENFS
ncbi:MAG: NAD-dependent epimerase/dehydratase family protein [Lachnospiraceae bacterium]|nr:NAD-dependent epimerase/dehydratase family protein [Lachnospiraceae bacterium]